MRNSFFAFAMVLVLMHAQAQKNVPIDRQATKETNALFKNLLKLSEQHTLFGH